MDINQLMESLASSFKQELPAELAILELRRSSVDDQQRRLRKLLKGSSEACDQNFERGQWETFDDHTLVRLPEGARAVLYHASGAVKLSSGLAPMEALFKEAQPKQQLADHTAKLLQSLGLHDALGRGETLSFERLWQIKAAATDRSGHQSEPVLCRAIGAFRHHIEGIPVLGPASAALQIAGNGEFDMLSTLLRSPGGEALDRAKPLHPERAVRQLLSQLQAKFELQRAKQDSPIDFECREGLRFGYLSLSKRKAQRLLAPVYMATIDVTHDKLRQGLILVTAATEKEYLPLNPPGQENPPTLSSKTAGKRCC